MASTENDDPAQIAHRVRMANGQTADAFVVEKYDGTDVFKVDASGYITKTYDPDAASYIVWKSGSTYYSKNGQTGAVAYSDTSFSSVMNSTYTALNTAGGGRIYGRGGSYTVDAKLVPKSKVQFVGEGWNATVLTADAGLDDYIFETGTDVTDILISDMKLVGNKANNTPAYNEGTGIFLAGATELVGRHTIERVWATDFDYYGIFVGNVNQVTVKNCRTDNCDYHGIALDNTDDSVIYGNWSHNNANYGIMMTGCHHSLVQGNHCYSNTLNGINTSNGGPLQLYDNVCRDNGAHGLNVSSTASGALVTIEGNHCFDNTLIGLQVYNTFYPVVQGNYSYNNSTAGINIQGCEAASVSGNYSYGNTTHGFTMSGAGHRSSLVGNWSYDNDGCGFVVDTCNNVLMNGNFAYTNDQHGIYLNAAQYAHIIGNMSINNDYQDTNTYDGLHLFGSSSIAVIRGNQLYSTSAGHYQRYGLYITAAIGCRISENTLGNGGTGAYYNGGGATNKASYNYGYTTENSGSSTGTGAQQTIAHGLSATPTRVILSESTTGGALAYRSAASDATNIYVTATADKTYEWEAKVV